MTASPIRRLLDARPFVCFTLHIGFEMQLSIDDSQRCRLDDQELILYVSYPALRPPEHVRRQNVIEPATIEIVDLRQVPRVSVQSESMPG